MKRSEALKLIGNQLDFLNGKFEGARDSFTKKELSNADVILTTLEKAGMLPPPYDQEYVAQVRYIAGLYGQEKTTFLQEGKAEIKQVLEWEPEND